MSGHCLIIHCTKVSNIIAKSLENFHAFSSLLDHDKAIYQAHILNIIDFACQLGVYRYNFTFDMKYADIVKRLGRQD